MSFFKKLVGAFTGGAGSQDRGVYVYIKIRRSGEIVRVRIDPINDVSADEDGQRFTRKLVMGSRSFEQVEATLYFDSNNRITSSDISGGELVSRQDYEAQANS